jgi:RNA polymerase sigma-70 factor (ECF subfamily)
MGMLQAYSSNILPMAGAPQLLVTMPGRRPGRSDSATSRQLNPDGTTTPRATDEEWAVVQQAIAGDINAQDYLFARHTGRLYQIAFSMLHNKEDAEDALQDAFCNAYTSLHSFRGRSSFSTWLTRIVINSALMTVRRKSTYREGSLDEILEDRPGRWLHGVIETRPDPEKICAAIEIKALIERHVGRLPAGMRAAFQLGEIDGLSARESSQVLDIPVSSYKSRIFRARRKLAGGLQKSLESNALLTGRRGRRNVFSRDRGKVIEFCW